MHEDASTHSTAAVSTGTASIRNNRVQRDQRGKDEGNGNGLPVHKTVHEKPP